MGFRSKDLKQMGYFLCRVCGGRQPSRRSKELATEKRNALKLLLDKRQRLVASRIDAPVEKNLEHSLTGGAERELS